MYGTHLIGGNLGYEFIGQLPSGEYTYKIILTTYTNCGPGSNIPEPEGPDLIVGIYQHDIQNSPLQGVDKVWLQDITITLIEKQRLFLMSRCSTRGSKKSRKGAPGEANMELK